MLSPIITVDNRSGILFMHLRILCGLFIVLTFSACDKKAQGQTVAVVNGEEITASELNSELSDANLPKGADQKEARSRALQALIDRRLLTAQAREDGLDRSPEFISRQRRMTEDLLLGMLASRQMDASKLPGEAELAQFQAQQPQSFAKREVWNLDQLAYETPKDPAVQARILKTKTLDEIGQVLSSSGIKFQRARNKLNTSLIPTDMYPRLSALPPGEPFVVPNGSRSVASVIISREPAPFVGPTARSEAVNMLRRDSAKNLMEQRLKDLRKAAKIEYKPGFAPTK